MSSVGLADDRMPPALQRIEILMRKADVFALAALLREDDGQYRGLSAGEADRIRGHVYAALARVAAPADDALRKRAREDLRTSGSPVVLAGIARWLARAGAMLDDPAGWRADLDAATARIEAVDRYPAFAFDPPATCCSPAKTALDELRACASGLPASDTASGTDSPATEPFATAFRIDAATRSAILLEDQDGERLHFSELVGTRPILIAFFYTRCMNPLKCSLTITRLGEALRARDLPPFDAHAISYDADYDDPTRLRGYGIDRGFPFASHARLLRCVGGRRALRSVFDLHVGFGGFTVNSHARELFLVTPDGDGQRLPPDALAQHDRLRAVLQRT